MLEFQRMQEHYAKKNQPAPYKTLGSFRKARRSDTLSPAFKKWRYHRTDQNTLDRWTKVKDFRNCPKTIENLQEIKYNKDTTKWALLKRERKTISKINAKNWTDSFHQKAIDAYYDFRKEGIEFTDHGVARYLQRNISFERVIEIHKKEFNYIQKDGRLVKYYNDQAIIYLPETKEIVSVIVNRKKPREDWDEIKN